MSSDGELGDDIALLGLVNILDIPVAEVSSSGEGLQKIYPSYHSQEEADFDSIALLGHSKVKETSVAFSKWAQNNRCIRRIKIEVWRRANY